MTIYGCIDVAQLSAADVNYTLKSVDPVFSSQLVNAFPFAGSKTYQLGKPTALTYSSFVRRYMCVYEYEDEIEMNKNFVARSRQTDFTRILFGAQHQPRG